MLGKHSGRHAVQQRCEELGVKLERHELDRVYRGVIAHADREKTSTIADLLKIVDRKPRRGAGHAGVRPGVDRLRDTPAEKGYGHGV